MMEIDPIYVQVIIDRWEKLTGEKAINISREKQDNGNRETAC